MSDYSCSIFTGGDLTKFLFVNKIKIEFLFFYRQNLVKIAAVNNDLIGIWEIKWCSGNAVNQYPGRAKACRVQTGWLPNQGYPYEPIRRVWKN